MMASQPNFDIIARPYRWLENLTLGRALERCRLHFLPSLLHQKNALVLGDGDGRFLAELLTQNPRLHAEAVDTSATMLQLLRHRCEAAAPDAPTRLSTHQSSALTVPLTGSYDLIVTHFFLDCLTQTELETLIHRIAPALSPQALWLISDFQIPTGPMRLPAKILIRTLYLAFRILTGLRTTQLPDHATPLQQAGLTRISHQNQLASVLVTELWQINPTAQPPATQQIDPQINKLFPAPNDKPTYNPGMPRTHRFFVATLLLPLALHAQTTPQPSIATNSPDGKPLSTRVVAYNIDAKLDTDKKTLDATETLTYKNLTGQSITAIPFHLYLNAFRPESTFTRETHFTGGVRDSEDKDSYPAEKLGSITISHIEADGYGDLTPAIHFIAPDDNNAEDHTVAEITLPHALAPNDSITFRLTFHDVFPLSVARNGWKRDFIMGGQWYPKPGVFWHGAWNCHQYHSTTEFFSDFATFHVSLTLPRRYIVGASGVPTGEVTNSDNTKTLSFYGEDIGDFAWAASPNFTITDGTYLSSLGPVKIHVLALAAHPKAGLRYLDIIQKTLAQFDHRYGPYPYKIITVIDPEPGSEIGGMEYPTLFTGGTSWYEPTHLTELAAEHEFGHQYWYGMVATNEFEDAWLDEGINSYTEVNVLGAILGPNTSVFDRPYANAGDYENERLEYVAKPDFDPVTRWAFKFRDAESYGGITYGKSATLLATLEGIIGRDTMDEAMRTYFLRYRFTHPTTEDFLRTIEEVAIKNGRATAIGGTVINASAQTPTPRTRPNQLPRPASPQSSTLQTPRRSYPYQVSGRTSTRPSTEPRSSTTQSTMSPQTLFTGGCLSQKTRSKSSTYRPYTCVAKETSSSQSPQRSSSTTAPAFANTGTV
jgi:ubiquinone/menaquinone biosynthesis C-methylase UbiE